MKVFSKEKFLKSEDGRKSWIRLEEWGVPEKDRWPSICDGKTPDECKKLGWAINNNWCIEKGEDNMKEAVQKFVDEKIAIAFTNPKQIREFAGMIKPFNLNVCGEPAYDWLMRSAERLFDSPTFGKHAFVHLTYNFGAREFANKVLWSSNDTIDDPHYLKRGWRIMAFEMFKNLGKIARMIKGDTFKMGKQEEKYKIEIVCDGDKGTVAKMIINGKTVKTAEAHRNPTDKFNFRIGAEYAFNRLFDKERPRFEVGDRVVCASAKRNGGYKSAKGEHGRVIENRSAGTFVNWIAVEFDNLLPGAHDCSGAGKKGHCFWVNPTELKHE